MRGLYESILSSDEESQEQIQQELNKMNVKKALVEFLHYLHVDNLEDVNIFKETFSPGKSFHRFKFNLKNYIDYITGIHHGSDQWYVNLNYEAMYIQCQNFIKNALKDFEKYLDKYHIKYKKYGKENFTYELLGERILFILFKVLETGTRKRYDQETKGSLKLRQSMKDWNWWFEFEVPKEIWNM